MNIVITGASKGIGYYTALHLAKDPENKIFALSRDIKGLNRLVEAGGSNGRIIIMECDISNDRSVIETVKKINNSVTGIEVLINNAGYLISKSFVELTSEEWRAVYDVNVFGVVRITRELYPLLLKGKISADGIIHSHIVNISSMGGIQGSIKFNGLSAYSSSKGALITLGECLSEELKSSGICVNSISLGSVDTEMFHSAFPGLKASANPQHTGQWIGEFALKGYEFFNGKNIPFSTNTP